MSQDNVKVVRAGYVAFARRDRDALRALIRDHVAPGFTWTSVVTGSSYKGPSGLLALIDDIEATVDYMPEVEEAKDFGDHVLIVLQTTGRGSQSGVPVTQRIAEIWTFQDDKVVSGRSYPSRAEALEAVGLRE